MFGFIKDYFQERARKKDLAHLYYLYRNYIASAPFEKNKDIVSYGYIVLVSKNRLESKYQYYCLDHGFIEFNDLMALAKKTFQQRK